MHSFDGHEGSENREKYLGDILDFVRDVREHNVIISYRLWNLQRTNVSELANRRNRETLEILEKEYNLDYEIQERVEMGKGWGHDGAKIGGRPATKAVGHGQGKR